MECRKCGACCIAISISSSIPGMPDGKPAGIACIHLTPGRLCALFDEPERPVVCGAFAPSHDTCGESFEQALELMETMEEETRPPRETGDIPGEGGDG